MTKADGPELAAAKRLLDVAKNRGFAFERIAPGPDGPLRGVRETIQFRDEIYLSGFRKPDSCSATRRQRSSLIVPRGPVRQTVSATYSLVRRHARRIAFGMPVRVP